MQSPEKDQECLDKFAELEVIGDRMADWVDHWAKEKPDAISIIEYSTGEEVTWKDFATKSKAFAAKLLSMGIGKGDVVATSLALLKEHIYLMYACFRIGAIIAPLDLRLKVAEVDRCFEKMHPKAYFFLGKTEVADFRPLVAEIMKKHGNSCKWWIQFQKEADLIMDGAIGVTEFAADIKKIYIKSLLTMKVPRAQKKVHRRDPCLIIFTTGSTGYPKPALICHEGILAQNISLSVGFELQDGDKMLVNLPPSHVGCTTEQLATTIYGGGVAVILPIFNPEQSLDAIQKYKVTICGQIPALFAMEWRLPNYKDYDISTLRFALYGGQAVTRQFLEQLASMAPQSGTGLGLTETSGFCSYTPLDWKPEQITQSVGYDSPLCPVSIRDVMNSDGSAGAENPQGEIGEICYTGSQIFLGYLNDPENTAKTLSKEGILYTGDLGFLDDMGLHFAGRSKLVIKPKGYQVFPTEVEDFIQQKLKSKVASVAAVGVQHDVFTEAIMVFVEKIQGQSLIPADVMHVCKEMAAYKRPTHVVIMESGEIPLNRVAKTDYLDLKERAKKIAEDLRKQGGWDKA